MSYRSLKRVLGETNLERKCRWLFGSSILILLGTAFWTVDRIAERLVIRTTERKGRDWAQLALLEMHWRWEAKSLADKAKQNSPGAAFGIVEDDVARRNREADDLARRNLFHTQLVPGSGQLMVLGEKAYPGTQVRVPENSQESQILAELKDAYRQQMESAEAEYRQRVDAAATAAAAGAADQTHAAKGPRPGEQAPLEELLRISDDAFDPVLKAFATPEQDKFLYYQPVYWSGWSQNCKYCHEGRYGSYVEAANVHPLDDPSRPFLVVKVVMPYATTKAAINRTRAILSSMLIVTVVTSMVALFLIIRYLIRRPLNHLRDVADAVAKGDLAERADIHTNDEFEELATSFNKMLQNLADAHSGLRTANRQLDHKVDELAQLNMQLNEMNRLKSEFLANMSHEVRTPMNSIIGFSEVLQGMDTLSDKQKRYVQNIQKAGRQLLDLINDILDLAKMESGRMEVRLTEFQIESLLHSQCDMVRALAESKNIDLRLEIEPKLPPMFQDQAKVQQILTNLLSNAIKFTPEGGRIVVSAKGDNRGRVEIAVSDTGVGISPTDKEIIFEKFRQGAGAIGQDNLTREYSGTGLGLSIVRELCKLLGGEVSLESELGKGSTFRVVLPWFRVESPVANRAEIGNADNLPPKMLGDSLWVRKEGAEPAEKQIGAA